jgi:hypothetical protein
MTISLLPDAALDDPARYALTGHQHDLGGHAEH